jgi:hypothetical protein
MDERGTGHARNRDAPVSFVLSLLFPLWVGVAAVLLVRRTPSAVGHGEVIPTATP